MISAPDHVARLFDSSATATDAMFDFVRDGLLAGDGVLVVTRAKHWHSIRDRCRAQGIDVEAARRAGWLVVSDAESTVAQLMRHDQIEWELFEPQIARLMSPLRSDDRRIRCAGEAVDVLARAGDFRNALRLEECWNRLTQSQPLTIFCSYHAEHFGNPRDADYLRQICNLHTDVHAHERDALGRFLLKRNAC